MTAPQTSFPLIQSLIEATVAGHERACRIQLDKANFVIVEPPGGRAYCNGNPATLFQTLRSHPVDRTAKYWHLTPRELSQSLDECEDGYTFAATALVWKAAQFAAARMTLDGDRLYEVRYGLRRWPNFTRLPIDNDDLRIAALWIQKPRTIYSVAAATKLPIEQVCCFFLAALSTGLLTESPIAEQTASQRRTGVFRNLLGLRQKGVAVN